MEGNALAMPMANAIDDKLKQGFEVVGARISFACAEVIASVRARITESFQGAVVQYVDQKT